jgi:homocysteine S-methyltransferase
MGSPRRDAFSALIDQGPVVIDGGLATHLEALGVDISGPLWSARILADQPEAIVAAHADFITAGAQVIITASYQVSRAGFVAQGRSADHADAALRRSVELAREAIHRQASDHRVLVAASVGPYGAITHDGGEYRGRYGLSHAQLVDFHAERIAILAEASPDLFAVETIPDVDEAAAIGEVLARYPDVPAWVSFSCGDEERTWAGQPITEAVAVIADAPTVAAVGVNCVHPELVSGLLERMATASDLPLVAYPNSGRVWLPDVETWSAPTRPVLRDDSPPEQALCPGERTTLGWPLAAWRAAGAQVIGGCCLVEPADIAGLALELTEC